MSKTIKRGFTIVELAIAMAFISVLLLSIVMISIQAGKMYSRGIALRSVNQSGRSIDTVMRQDFLQTNSRQVSKNSDNTLIFTTNNIIGGVSKPINRRFCLGSYSYIWNTPEVIDSDGGTYDESAVVLSEKPINFARVVDPNAILCEVDASGKYLNELDAFIDGVTHLLKMPDADGEVVLAVHSLQFLPVAVIDDQPEALYRITMTIGTSKMSEINTADQSCRPPAEGESNFEFCAINQFDTIVRTNG